MTTDSQALSDRERNAERLLRTSAKHSYDPMTEIDWSAPIDPDQFALPPHRVTLYGTELWRQLTPRQQAELSTRQLAGTMTAGIWFEILLMNGLIRHVYGQDLTTRHAQYALTEVADECRHSTMFAEYIRKTGYPTARPSRRADLRGRFYLQLNDITLTLAGAIFVEEFTDAMQREMMRDESLQPLARATARIHVVEEARHIGFAKPELARRWGRMTPARRALFRRVLAFLASEAVRECVHPRIYTLTGLDAVAAKRAARDNPHWQQARVDWARKAVDYFTDLGIIDASTAPAWRRAHLLR
ncbi:diiron oxygenase [Kitasatospora acidiphila]|uniref:Diiron oxygenase n=1 Tax=Kitasatospora acidiphila TaxID=2567942 RepID=A0A540W052_9ACTN|nr:diiron oxygenase [Kitasatospora acidiphila]TQF02363.1 diiron oxygenase [Kitasatospora acidiphila]